MEPVENKEVKIPALVHLASLGYEYQNTNLDLDPSTNINKKDLKASIEKLNHCELSDKALDVIIGKLNEILDQDDLGRGFYQVLHNGLDNTDQLLGTNLPQYIKLIDFSHEYDHTLKSYRYNRNNDFKVVTELFYKGDTSNNSLNNLSNQNNNFIPDITLFINGLPLVYIEVKRAYNHSGGKVGFEVEAEKLYAILNNPSLRKFVNITQLVLTSNNVPYQSQDRVNGSFYTSFSSKIIPNPFREEDEDIFNREPKVLEATEIQSIIKDAWINNSTQVDSYIKTFQPEPESPCNGFLTSTCSKDRLLQLLQYGLVYVDPTVGASKSKKTDNTNKTVANSKLVRHVIRYSQFFAMQSIINFLHTGASKPQKDNNLQGKGIIWHTQGSGKTALCYFTVQYLKDHFLSLGVTPQFFFVVDRNDLEGQTCESFQSRGLSILPVDKNGKPTKATRENLKEWFKVPANDQERQALLDANGNPKITVVTIQSFDSSVPKEATNYQKKRVELNLNDEDSAAKVQRIFFIDEAHRSYTKGGRNLSNLNSYNSYGKSKYLKDIHLALTGTPIVDEDESAISNQKVLERANITRANFGNYIHLYLYNKSIADGYTVDISYSNVEITAKLPEKLKEELVAKKSLDSYSSRVKRSENYTSGLIDTILKDFSTFRRDHPTVGAMVICPKSKDGVSLTREIFEEICKRDGYVDALNSDPSEKAIRVGLILSDNQKATTNRLRTRFISGEVDILVVHRMLTTGFDAPRLKKLYLADKLQKHHLLQALTRVNRPYNNIPYGYVMDFAENLEAYKKITSLYTSEANKYLDNKHLPSVQDKLLIMPEDVVAELLVISDIFAKHDIKNLEQLKSLDRAKFNDDDLAELRNAVTKLISCYHIAITAGFWELFEKNATASQLSLRSICKDTSLSMLHNIRYILEGMLQRKDTNMFTQTYMTSQEFDELLLQFEAFRFKVDQGVHLSGVTIEPLVLVDKVRNLRHRLTDKTDKIDPDSNELILLTVALEQLLHKHNIILEKGEDPKGQLQKMSDDLEALEKRYQDYEHQIATLHRDMKQDVASTRTVCRIIEQQEAKVKQDATVTPEKLDNEKESLQKYVHEIAKGLHRSMANDHCNKQRLIADLCAIEKDMKYNGKFTLTDDDLRDYFLDQLMSLYKS